MHHKSACRPGVVTYYVIRADERCGAGSAECLYNDAHFYIQDFEADGPHIADILKMITVARK